MEERLISKRLLVYETKENKYYAVFYSEIYLSDIEPSDVFVFTASYASDPLKKDDSNIKGRIFIELERAKPIIRKFIDDFLLKNNKYKYWRISIEQNIKNIRIIKSANEIYNFFIKNPQLDDKEKCIKEIERIITERL